MSRFFTDIFLNPTDGLANSEAVLDGSTLRLVLFRTAPRNTDLEGYSSYDTVAELVATPGWDEAQVEGYPLTATITPGRVTEGDTQYISFNSFVLTDLEENVEVMAVGIEYVGTLDGVTNPLILVSTDPFPAGTTILSPEDNITSYLDPTPGVRWLMAWADDASSGASRVSSLTSSLLALAIGPPEWEGANTFEAWMMPQRVNYIVNPSFELPANDFWATDGSLTRAVSSLGGFCGEFTGTVAESNKFPVLGETDFTVKFMLRADGPVQVGLVYWDESYDGTAVDWGLDTEVWEAPDDTSWVQVRCLRRTPEGVEAMLRIECDGTEFAIDQVIVEPGVLLDWPYFDGYEIFGARGDYSWYGDPGESFSLWYNNRNSISSRLYKSPGVDPTYEFTEKDVNEQGLAYNWVPAGTEIVPHFGVLYPHDIKTPPKPKTILESVPPRIFSDTAPGSPVEDTLWVDTSDDNQHKVWVGGAWVEIT